MKSDMQFKIDGIDTKAGPPDVDDILAEHKKNQSQRDIKRENRLLKIEIERKEHLIEAYESYKDKPIKKIVPRYSKHKEEGTVLSLCSDVHIEHKITFENTNGINKQDPESAAEKLKRYFTGLVKLTENNRRDIKLDNLVIGLLGDNIHGFIHEEYLRTNYMTPVEAMLFVIDQFKSGFDFLLNHAKFKKIVVVCKVGNHSRTTDKIYTDNEALHSYEWAIYQMLAKIFPAIEWKIENSYFSYYTVYDKLIRFHHGHGFRYGGGIGGIYVPLQRYRLRINQQRKADLDCIGHWHTADWLRNTKTLINGSTCGFDSYAMRSGFEPEPPTQQFLIIDKKRGFTINSPIILE